MAIFSGGIAFFDSGIGGLTVLQSCLDVLKNQTVYYYGDNLRAPYGNLPQKTIRSYVLQAFDTFASLNVQAAVIACNTVTALCIDELRQTYDFPIIGTEPAIFPAAKDGGEVLVLCTKRTAESERLHALKQKSEKRYKNAHITLSPCEKLAGLIEKSPFAPPDNLCEYLPSQTADRIVLGCTHYSYYKKYIEAFYNRPVYDANEGIRRRLARTLRTIPAKNRDERPLTDFFAHKSEVCAPKPLFFSLSQYPTLQNQIISPQNIQITAKNPQDIRLFFLGSGHENNENICKQMFAFNKKG